MLSKTLKKVAVFAAAMGMTLSAYAVEVDLLIIYDDYTASRYNGDPSAVMTAWVENINAAYEASQVDIQVKLVGLEPYEASSSSMQGQLSEITRSAKVQSLRKQHGADFVSFVSTRDGNICGIAWLAVRAGSAFNVNGVQCGYLTMAHELGHNMGLGHSRRQGDSGGARYRYGLGYGVDQKFSTVMAYPQSFGTRNHLNQFSDPNRDCQGVACGVAIGNTNEADAHTALNNVKFDIANFIDSVDNGSTNPPPAPPVEPTPEKVAAPSSLAASVASNAINLKWRDNSTGERYFEVQRSTQSQSAFSEITKAAANATTFTDDDLTSGTYYYRVRAVGDSSVSEWSNVSGATIAADTDDGTVDLPSPTGEGLNLINMNFRLYTRQIGRDARAYISRDGTTMALQNNVWVASSTRFTITSDTVLHFDYSSNMAGEIHGIGFDENSNPSADRIFKLDGSQNWGISQFVYDGNGTTQQFSIPVGQYYTGSMRLVMSNDNDAGSGNESYFSNVRITNDAKSVSYQQSGDYVFGMDYIDESTALLYHHDGQLGEAHMLCLNNDCQPAALVNGRYERTVNVDSKGTFLIEYRLHRADRSSCSASAVISYNNGNHGHTESACD